MDVDNFLAHYGIKGMKWGVRRDTPRLTRRERLEKAYSTKYGEAVAKTKVDSRLRTEKILLIAGSVTITAAASIVVGRKLHSEFAPVNLKKSTVLQNINQHGKDLDLDKVTFATFKKGDNKIYRGKFVEELLSRTGRGSDKVYATQLKPVKDLKIPSKAKARELFVEWEKSRGIVPKTSSTVKINGVTRKIKSNVTTRMVNSNRSNQITGNKPGPDSFLAYVAKQGFDGIQDVMDQRKGSYNASKPLMLFNGAQSVMVKGAEFIETSGILNRS